jgi:hypothetical protein
LLRYVSSVSGVNFATHCRWGSGIGDDCSERRRTELFRMCVRFETNLNFEMRGLVCSVVLGEMATTHR